MGDYESAVFESRLRIKELKSKKRRNGTKIYYEEQRLKRLLENPEKEMRDLRSNSSPRRSQKSKTPQIYRARACPENTAYVLSLESRDLIRALWALERMR